MDVRPSCLLCVVRPLRRADHSVRGVLIVCDLETSKMKRPRPELGCRATENKAVNRSLFTAEARVQSQAGPCGICIRQISTGIGFSQCTWMLLFQHLSSSAPHSSIYRCPYISLAMTASLNYTL
jgi:hypothetical protein